MYSQMCTFSWGGGFATCQIYKGGGGIRGGGGEPLESVNMC